VGDDVLPRETTEIRELIRRPLAVAGDDIRPAASFGAALLAVQEEATIEALSGGGIVTS
jgi:hypothetical protein